MGGEEGGDENKEGEEGGEEGGDENKEGEEGGEEGGDEGGDEGGEEEEENEEENEEEDEEVDGASNQRVEEDKDVSTKGNETLRGLSKEKLRGSPGGTNLLMQRIQMIEQLLVDENYRRQRTRATKNLQKLKENWQVAVQLAKKEEEEE